MSSSSTSSSESTANYLSPWVIDVWQDWANTGKGDWHQWARMTIPTIAGDDPVSKAMRTIQEYKKVYPNATMRLRDTATGNIIMGDIL